MSRHLELVRKVKKCLPVPFKRAMPQKVTVIEISEHESLRISRRYLQKNKLANVLSFRYGKDYGEVLICPEVVRREAKEQGNTYKYQMTWMILHGMIHLAGVHHERSKAVAQKVARWEQKALDQLAGKNSKFRMSSNSAASCRACADTERGCPSTRFARSGHFDSQSREQAPELSVEV